MQTHARSFLALIGVLVAACTDAPSATTPNAGPSSTANFSRDGGAASFTRIDVAGATIMFPLDINDHGVIVGRYTVAGHSHGFIRDESGVISPIDFPGSSFTVAASVNDSGAVVGWYVLPAAPTVRHGFILRDGVATTIDPPGSTFTNILGINERGDVTGRFCTLTVCRAVGIGDFRGFVYHDGEFTYINVPGSLETDAFKNAASGDISGGFSLAGGAEEMFILHHGAFTTFALPNGKAISLDNGGMNSHGDLVGSYCVASTFPCLIGPTGVRGFLLQDGEMTEIDVPGAATTAAAGINARGDIVGSYIEPNGAAHGFLRRVVHGGG